MISLRPGVRTLVLSVNAAAACIAASACGSIERIGPNGGAGGQGGFAGDAAVPDAPVETVVTVAEGCQQVATAICNQLEACAPITVKFFYVDKPTCVARSTLSCMADQSVPGISRTAHDLVTCATDVASATCPDLLASKLPASCLVKPGPQPATAACGSDWQCATTYCQKTTACGVCAARAAAGGACTVDNGCQTGLVCANSVCVTPGTLAQACDINHPCRSDLYCTKLIAGSCQQKVGMGGSCADADAACDLLKSVACNGSTKVCDVVNVARGGDACGLINNGLTICVDLNPCSGLVSGVCANLAADGAACGDAANGVHCAPPATCETGVCRLPSAPNCI